MQLTAEELLDLIYVVLSKNPHRKDRELQVAIELTIAITSEELRKELTP